MYDLNSNTLIQRQLVSLDSTIETTDIVKIQKEIHRLAQLQFENRYPNKSIFENPKETLKISPIYYVMLNEFPLESLEINI